MELPACARADMRVPARVFVDPELIGQIAADRSLEQLQNVATLPGIIDAALARQPVFIPGSMGTSSFVLAGRQGAMQASFGTTCHGAGRRISRTGARREITGAELRHKLEAQGIVVRCPSNRGLAEEAPFAYKDVERAGLAARVAQLVPLGVVKG
jgi:RNA-splicing ligase RtcB